MPTQPLSKPITRIAVLRYRYIGDSILALPFLYRLRMAFPQAIIHLFTSKDSLDLMRITAPVNYCYIYEPHHLKFWDRIQALRQNYDQIYILKRSFSSALYPFLACIPKRIGFNTEGRRFLLTRAIPYKPTEQHEAKCYLDLLSDFARNIPLELPELSLRHLPKLKWPEPTLPPKPWIVINPVSSNMAKAWPVHHYQELVKNLAQTIGGTYFCFGLESEKDLLESILSQLPENTPHYNLAGKTTLPETLSYFREMDLLIGGDSGLAHLCALAKTPQVTLFGPTDPKQWAPLSNKATTLTLPEKLDCQPCRLKITCNNTFPCLTDLTPKMVYEAALTHLTAYLKNQQV